MSILSKKWDFLYYELSSAPLRNWNDGVMEYWVFISSAWKILLFMAKKAYATSCTTYPLPYCGHTCCSLDRICSPIQTMDQTIRHGVLEYWIVGVLGRRLCVFDHYSLAQTWLGMLEFYAFRLRNITATGESPRKVAPGRANIPAVHYSMWVA